MIRGEAMKGLLNAFKGMIIGITILIPGLSGGTMAMILGIYEDLIHAFSSFTADLKNQGQLLLQVSIGGLLSLGAFSYIIAHLLNKYPHRIQFLFMGIIIGSLPILYDKYKNACTGEKYAFLYFIAGCITVIVFSSDLFTITSRVYHEGFVLYLLMFMVGILVSIALVLPGISGSLVLTTLGLYEVTLRAINELNFQMLIPLSLGIIAGILLGSRLVKGLLLRYPGKVYMVLIGFVTASIIPIFPGMPNGTQYFPSIIIFAAGGLIITVCRLSSKTYKG